MVHSSFKFGRFINYIPHCFAGHSGRVVKLCQWQSCEKQFFTTLPLEERLIARIVILYKYDKTDSRLTFRFQPPAEHQVSFCLWDAISEFWRTWLGKNKLHYPGQICRQNKIYKHNIIKIFRIIKKNELINVLWSGKNPKACEEAASQKSWQQNNSQVGHISHAEGGFHPIAADGMAHRECRRRN